MPDLVQSEIPEIQQSASDATAAVDDLKARTKAELKNRAQRRVETARARRAERLKIPSPARTLTRDQMAALYNVSPDRITMYERTDPTFPKALRLGGDPRNPKASIRFLESDAVAHLRSLQARTQALRVNSGGDPNAADPGAAGTTDSAESSK